MAKVIREDVKDIAKQFQHYPGLAALVTAHAKGKDNVMAVAWHTPLSASPPLYGITIAPKRFTYQLISESKEFAINFLPFEVAELVAAVGGCSGSEVDKFHRFNIAKDRSAKTAAPILKAAYAAYECQLVDDREYGDHRFLVGRIVAVHWLKEVFTAEGQLDMNKVNPILYLGSDVYLTTSKDTVRLLDREVYSKGI